jgi:hypothetical protein
MLPCAARRSSFVQYDVRKSGTAQIIAERKRGLSATEDDDGWARP